MQTVYDWTSLGLFAVIAWVYLQRSINRPRFSDPVIRYLPPTLGCVLGNWLGNQGYSLGAVSILIASAFYTVIILRPFR
jgi:hypothetical protein